MMGWPSYANLIPGEDSYQDALRHLPLDALKNMLGHTPSKWLSGEEAHTDATRDGKGCPSALCVTLPGGDVAINEVAIAHWAGESGNALPISAFFTWRELKMSGTELREIALGVLNERTQ